MANQLQQSLMGYSPEVSDIERQRKMAQMLVQQGLSPSQGQMIGNRYVGASPFEHLANLAKVWIGKSSEEQLDKKQQQLAEALRRETSQDLASFMEAQRNRPAQEQILGTQTNQLPQGQTMLDEMDQPTLVQAAMPERKADYNKAMAIALNSRSPMVQGLGTQMLGEMMKPQKLSEGEEFVKINPSTGQYETVAKGAEKYRAPISVDTGTSTVLLDPKTMKPIAQYNKATSGTVQETENGLVLIDPRTGVSRPITDQSGQLLQGGGKPLNESQSNAVAFGIRAKESNRILTELEKQGVTNTGLIKGTAQGTLGAVPLIGDSLSNLGGALTNWTASEGQQSTDQARRNFVTAVLRKESGAAISPSEFANEERKYFPQIGDSDKVIKQKQEARELAIKALEVQAGKGGAKLINSQQNLGLSPQDQEALNWANSNPNDKRSALIKQRLGR